MSSLWWSCGGIAEVATRRRELERGSWPAAVNHGGCDYYLSRDKRGKHWHPTITFGSFGVNYDLPQYICDIPLGVQWLNNRCCGHLRLYLCSAKVLKICGYGVVVIGRWLVVLVTQLSAAARWPEPRRRNNPVPPACGWGGGGSLAVGSVTAQQNNVLGNCKGLHDRLRWRLMLCWYWCCCWCCWTHNA